MTDETGLQVSDVHYNPVTVNEAVGTIFLGILALILLAALLRAQARCRELLRKFSSEHQEARIE
jgi:hypothetical protein